MNDFITYAQEIAIENLVSSQVSEMYNLFSKYYSDTSKELFINDMNKKETALVLYNNINNIIGFTLAKTYYLQTEIGSYGVIYFGDTIIEHDFRGKFAQPIHDAMRIYSSKLLDKEIDNAVLFLPSSGFLTYKYLTSKFIKFYPRYDQDTPENELRVMKDISNTIFGEGYKIISSNPMVIKLNDKDFSINKLNLQMNPQPPLGVDNHIDFWAQVNPQWQEGVELICLGYITKESIAHWQQNTKKLA